MSTKPLKAHEMKQFHEIDDYNDLKRVAVEVMMAEGTKLIAEIRQGVIRHDGRLDCQETAPCLDVDVRDSREVVLGQPCRRCFLDLWSDRMSPFKPHVALPTKCRADVPSDVDHLVLTSWHSFVFDVGRWCWDVFVEPQAQLALHWRDLVEDSITIKVLEFHLDKDDVDYKILLDDNPDWPHRVSMNNLPYPITVLF